MNQRTAGADLSRVGRLTRKELRETLRDRRTIVTLVLMPLLVYPLLSVVFKQFLLSNLQETGQVEWRIAASSDREAVALSALLKRGEQLLAARSPAPVGTANVPPAGSDGPQAKDVVILTYTGERLADAVGRGEIDLGVVARPPAVQDGRPTPVDFQLIYQPDSTAGVKLAKFVKERLQAINDEYVSARLRQLGDSAILPTSWQLSPLPPKEGGGFQLATLVPMILILMTITGAVYPAIDLTAGERERGTLEALMAAPVPRLGLLLAKYLTVLTVALLTALVNIVGMTVTLLSTGLGPLLFGERGLSLGAVVVVFALLVLFAAFFAAVLLCVTSFARSFKEAQAYLIPLMMVSLAPGFLSLIPDLRLNAWLSVAPLANIVLLARDVLAGQVQPVWAFIAVATTALYAAAALGMAARIFGSDSILYGSQSGWSDLFRRPREPLAHPTLAGGMACLALVVPLYVVFSGFLAQLAGRPMATQLAAGAATLILLFAVVPALIARAQGVRLVSGLQLMPAPWLGYLGAIVLGCSLAPLAYELILLSQQIGLATISQEKLAEKAPLVNRLIQQWRQLPPAVVLVAIALVPAIAEEFFFRGYLLGAMRGRLPAGLAIAFTALVFGLFHASVGGIVAVERVLSSTALGLVLGWVCWTTRSVLPGILLHTLNNAFVVALAYWGDGFKSLGWDADGQTHLPATFLAVAAATAALGALLIYLGRRPPVIPPLPASPLAAETPPR